MLIQPELMETLEGVSATGVSVSLFFLWGEGGGALSIFGNPIPSILKESHAVLHLGDGEHSLFP